MTQFKVLLEIMTGLGCVRSGHDPI